MASQPVSIKQQMIAFHQHELTRHRETIAYATMQWGKEETEKGISTKGTKVHTAAGLLTFHEAAIEFLTA
jgi:hypothetical protein